MTTEQQAALETLIGRALTSDEITAFEAYLPQRNDVELTALVNAAIPDVIGSIPVETVFDVIFTSGDYATLKQAQLIGNSLAVMAFSMLEDAKKIGNGRVDLGSAITIGMLDQLIAANLMTAGCKQALISAATAKSITRSMDEVSRALNIAEGRMVI